MTFGGEGDFCFKGITLGGDGDLDFRSITEEVPVEGDLGFKTFWTEVVSFGGEDRGELFGDFFGEERDGELRGVDV